MASKPSPKPKPQSPKPGSSRPDVSNVMLHLSHSDDSEKKSE